MNLDIIKYRLFRVVTVFSCSLLPFGCVQDDDVACDSESTSDNVSLQLKVDSAGDNNGTAPTDDEAKIHTLRVYAFAEIPQGDKDADKDGRLVGYYYTNSPTTTTAPITFDMDIKFYKKGSQTVNFYVVANEGAMSTPGVVNPLTEKTTEQVLKEYTFTQINGPVGTNGLPMYHQSSVTLSKAGPNSINFKLKRPIGKLEVFAAKPVGETTALKITGLTLLESGTRARNYLMPQDLETLQSITSIAGDITINADMVIEAMQDGDKTNPDNYKCIQQSPTYVFENPWGSNNWNIKGDDKGGVLKIDYSYGNEPRSGLVYFPRIQRNKYYAVYCLFHNEGKISVSCKVADWEHKLYPEMVFDYPTYSNPIQPYTNPDGWTEGQKYPKPTVYNSNDPTDKWAGSYSFRFNMSGPTGQYWKPTLYGTPDGFEVSVWKGGQEVQETEKGFLVSPDDYEIKVRATKSENVGKEVGLGISYQPSWTTQAMLLLINGVSTNLKWEGSDKYPELIMIEQREPPITPTTK